MSAFYTTNLETLWTGYLSSSAYGYRGILLDLDFQVYTLNNNEI